MWRRYERGDIGEVTYAEGEYIHDCTSIWPQITYGDRNHWRNRLHPFYYCTHSLGPLITITGRRPVQVTGITTRLLAGQYMLGLDTGMAALEMVTLDNGAFVKSIHGGLRREPPSINYEVYGTHGSMETQRFGEENLNVYVEGDKACHGKLETYIPEKFVSSGLAAAFGTHGGSDFYATHFFVERILGRPDGLKYSVDVFTAVDMGICGILAYRSNLNGGMPVAVPDLRNPKERGVFRSDNACTNPAVAGDQLLPHFAGAADMPLPTNGAYDSIKDLWLAGRNFDK
jgi:hypothetical protein